MEEEKFGVGESREVTGNRRERRRKKRKELTLVEGEGMKKDEEWTRIVKGED